MKNTSRILILLTFVFFFSCEEQGLFIKCSDCSAEEPLNTNLEIKLDLNKNGLYTLVKIYEGNLEDSILYKSQSTNITYSLKVPVSINKKYTVTATYYIHDNYYTTVDSATPRVKYEKDQCDDPCYFVYDKVVDLRLKYTN
jgi:hypothetical protein